MNNIRELRKRKGIQQKELALEMGVSNATVSDWEHGRKNPTRDRQKKLAEFFGVDELVIIGSKSIDESVSKQPHDLDLSKMPETEKIFQFVIDELERRSKTPEMNIVSEMMGRMTADQQKQVVAVMKAMFPDILEKATNK
jgi:transcriptional regulator with XRE-family HTH domain